MMQTIGVLSVTLALVTLKAVTTEAQVSIPIVDAFKETCGVRRLKANEPALGIVGGVKAGEAEFPWIVSIQLELREGKNFHFCGASLLSDRWILSAAHCFAKFNQTNGLVNDLERLTVLVGSNNNQDGSGDRYTLEKIAVHENYNGDNYQNDIALLRTKEKINFKKTPTNYKVNSVCLPPFKSDTESYPPAEAVVSGWGYTKSGDAGSAAKELLKVKVKSTPYKECATVFADGLGFTVSEKAICYGKGAADACQGDSGGPLTKLVGDRVYQIGLVSVGHGCGTEFPGVYTDVKAYRDWIKKMLY